MNTTRAELDEVLDFVSTKTAACQGVDYAVTLKEGEVHVMCDIKFRDPLMKIFENHKVQIVTLHTYLIGA